MGKDIREGLKKAVMETKQIITGADQTSIRVKPSEMRDAMMVYLEKNQYDPIQSLINIAQDKDVVTIPDPDNPGEYKEVPAPVDVSHRIGIHKEFLRYLAPAMKVSDPDKGAEASFEIYINKFVLEHSGVPKQVALEEKTAEKAPEPESTDIEVEINV